eukprot:31338_1
MASLPRRERSRSRPGKRTSSELRSNIDAFDQAIDDHARQIESERAKLALDLGAQFGDIKGIGRPPRISRRTTVTGAPNTTRARTRDLTAAYTKRRPAAPAMVARGQQVAGGGGAMTARPSMMRRSSLNAPRSRQKRGSGRRILSATQDDLNGSATDIIESLQWQGIKARLSQQRWKKMADEKRLVKVRRFKEAKYNQMYSKRQKQIDEEKRKEREFKEDLRKRQVAQQRKNVALKRQSYTEMEKHWTSVKATKEKANADYADHMRRERERKDSLRKKHVELKHGNRAADEQARREHAAEIARLEEARRVQLAQIDSDKQDQRELEEDRRLGMVRQRTMDRQQKELETAKREEIEQAILESSLRKREAVEAAHQAELNRLERMHRARAEQNQLTREREVMMSEDGGCDLGMLAEIDAALAQLALEEQESSLE